MLRQQNLQSVIDRWKRQGFSFVAYIDDQHGLCIGVPGNTSGYAAEALGVYDIEILPTNQIQNNTDAERIRKAIDELKPHKPIYLPKHYIPLDILEIKGNFLNAKVNPESIDSLRKDLERVEKGYAIIHVATYSSPDLSTYKKYLDVWSELGEVLLLVNIL